jgi:hypothetical protein
MDVLVGIIVIGLIALAVWLFFAVHSHRHDEREWQVTTRTVRDGTLIVGIRGTHEERVIRELRRPWTAPTCSGRCAWPAPTRSVRPTRSTERPASVRVREAPVGVQPRAHRLEALPPRVARRERRGRLEVTLAPVRARVVLVADRLHGAEVRLPRHSARVVDRDVGGRAPARRAEQRVVAGDEAHLDREVDRKRRAVSRTRSTTSRAASRG